MTKDKQIEEMAKEIRAIKEHMYQSGATIGEIRVGITHSERIAKHLIDNIGYRKASDVAREMCGMLREDLRGFVDGDYLERLIKIYEKKYSESEKGE